MNSTFLKSIVPTTEVELNMQVIIIRKQWLKALKYKKDEKLKKQITSIICPTLPSSAGL